MVAGQKIKVALSWNSHSSGSTSADRLMADLDLRLTAKALWGMLNWTHRWHKPNGTASVEDIANTKQVHSVWISGGQFR